VLPLLLLKLTLVPCLVAAAALAGKRFGQSVGGWLIGFPIVAGPVLWFYAHEQGDAFASRAALGMALGVVSLCGFLLAYAWAARSMRWAPSLLLGWATFSGVTLVLASFPHSAEFPLWVAGLLPCLALTLTLRGLPHVPDQTANAVPRLDLGARMLMTGLLVLTLTSLAPILGPVLSGLFSPFPVATTILVVFAHREQGPAGVLAVYDGFIPSLYSFVAFSVALSFALARWATLASFAFALVICAISQSLVFARLALRAPRQ